LNNENKINLKRGNLVELQIVDSAFGGKGIARVETENGQFVVFVPNTIKGQTVRARVIKKRKKHAECKLKEIIKRSDLEVDQPYQEIPGGPYMRYPIELQQADKKNDTFQLFSRIGQLKEPESVFDEFIPSPRTWHYRNKMEYSFSSIVYDLETGEEYDGFGLGFKHRGQWWSVENLERDSGLFDPLVENNLKTIRTWCEQSNLPAWCPPRAEGFYRYLGVRKSFHTQRFLIELVTSASHLDQFDLNGFTEMITKIFGDHLGGFLHSINTSTGDRSHDVNMKTSVIKGEPLLKERLLDLDFEISMRSFFQPNPASAEKLYSKAVEYALEGKSTPDEVIMDLFCGTGTIGQILSKKSNGATEIIGVDIVESAIANAKKNAALNQLSNLIFYAADVNKFLYEYPQYRGKINTIVLDPPRGGIAPKALKRIIQIEAPRIVYISCNPATQARDNVELQEAGYEVKKLSMVDQFPHTSHIETVVLYEKN
jgi:23S rRNA (uracil-5-)-methyltransferase RumA